MIIKKTMRHLALKGEVCDRRSSHQGRKSLSAIKNQRFLRFGCSRNNSILKDGVFFKFLDMNKKRANIVFVILILALLIFIPIFMPYKQTRIKNETISVNETPKNSEIVLGDSCSNDLDCVPASCCHASACVQRNAAPECRGTICSQECKPGTLDCRQASCACINNKCGVIAS